jgi:three-Cys-motif partner protein
LRRKSRLRFDEIGYWSEVKLDIVKNYAVAYSTILAAQQRPRLFHVYIDAFAGAGLHISKTRGRLVPGSPLNALEVQPPFREYHCIDLKREKQIFYSGSLENDQTYGSIPVIAIPSCAKRFSPASGIKTTGAGSACSIRTACTCSGR